MKHIDFSHPAPQHNPFTIPQGYFEGFTERMMRSIQQRETFIKHEMPIIRWIPWLGVACCAALMFIFTYAHEQPPQHQGTNVYVASSTTTNTSNNTEAVFDYYYNTDTKYWAYESDY